MTTVESNPASSTGPADEVRVSVVSGDRLCTRCSYNLTGQTVTRETHYGLLIVRCPECATVASLQEYPLLGRWATRWGVLLAVLWFILLLGMWLATSAATFGWSVGMAEDASRPFSDFIQIRMQSDQAAVAAKAGTAGGTAGGTAAGATAGTTTITTGGTTIVTPAVVTTTWGAPFLAWWKTQDPDELFAAAGGWRGAVRWTALMILIPGSLASFGFGLFWSIALLRFRRRWLVVWALFIIALASLFAVVTLSDWYTRDPSWSSDAARSTIAPTILIASIAYSCLPLILGMYFGRPLTRLGVRSLLPPGLRGSLAILWTSEGLEPPPVRK